MDKICAIALFIIISFLAQSSFADEQSDYLLEQIKAFNNNFKQITSDSDRKLLPKLYNNALDIVSSTNGYKISFLNKWRVTKTKAVILTKQYDYYQSEINDKFFLDLAKKVQSQHDISFFEQLISLKSEGEKARDVFLKGECQDSKKLTEIEAKVSQLKNNFPEYDSYKIRDYDFTASTTCFCDSKNDVIKNITTLQNYLSSLNKKNNYHLENITKQWGYITGKIKPADVYAERENNYRFDGQCKYAEYTKNLKIPKKLHEYKNLYSKISASKEKQSIEPLYELGEEAKAAFFQSNSDEVINDIVWGASDTRNKFEHEMRKLAPGYQVVQGAEIFYYDLDTKAYLDLAKKHGTKEDIKFFQLYDYSFSSSEYWPIYVEQQSDITGCTSYGKPEYLEFYKRWAEFAKNTKSPYYENKAKEYLASFDIEGRCSCNSKEETIKGLQNLSKFATNLTTKKTIEAEILKRTNMPYSPPNQAGGWYGYNAEQCGG